MISSVGQMEDKLLCLKPAQSRSAFTVQVVIKYYSKTHFNMVWRSPAKLNTFRTEMQCAEEKKKKKHAVKFPRVQKKEKALCTVCPYANVGQMIRCLSSEPVAVVSSCEIVRIKWCIYWEKQPAGLWISSYRSFHTHLHFSLIFVTTFIQKKD